MNDTEFKLRVMVVEDEQKILNSITRKIYNVANDCEIVGTARNGMEALELIEKLRPNIVFTDIKMPIMDGLTLSKAIKTRFSGIEVVIISGFPDFSFAQEAIKYGVFSYIIKPVDDQKLKEVIDDIRVRFEESASRKSRSFTLPQVVTAQNQLIKQMPDDSQIVLFLFCFDNLCYDNTDEVIEKYYGDKMVKIDWVTIIGETESQSGLWIVTDEIAVNQRMLMVVINEGESLDAQMTAQTICNRITQLSEFKSINTCCHINPIRKSEMWVYAKRMRNVLRKSVVLTKPKLYIVDRDECTTEELSTTVIKHRLDTIIKTFMKSSDYDKFCNEVQSFFSYLYQTNMAQKQVEKMILHILHTLENNVNDYDTMLSEQLQSDLFRILCKTDKYEEIEAHLFICIDNFFHHASESGTKKNTQTAVLDYVDKNFLTINKIDEVTEAFHYNNTYLSRMFKKMTGTTMIKYITLKRMEYAKKIIEADPEIMIGMVGVMVGYEDQHYFSRIFKLFIGESPSEYKINVTKSNR